MSEIRDGLTPLSGILDAITDGNTKSLRASRLLITVAVISLGVAILAAIVAVLK